MSPNGRQKRVVVSKAKARKYEKPCNKIVTNEGMIEVYRLAKTREKLSGRVTNVRRVKGEDQKVLIDEEDVESRHNNILDPY